jgi:hypothetical protein
MGRENTGDRAPVDDGSGFVVEKGPEEPASLAILRGVAALTGVTERNLDPFYESVDPDALNSLVSHARESDCSITVEFAFEGCTVRVRGDGTIRITERHPGE